MSRQQISIGTVIKGVIALVAIFFLVSMASKVFESNSSGHYKVLQRAFTGKMMAITQEGVFGQWWGDVFDYHQSDTFHFNQEKGNDGKVISPGSAISVRFSDGSTAWVNGSVRFVLPSEEDKLISIHRKFRSFEGVVNGGIQALITEAIVLSSGLMSAEESYTTKKSFLTEMAYDQVMHGVYLTEQAEELVEESQAEEGQKQAKRHVVRIKKDAKNMPLRRANPMAEYGISLLQFVITDIDYEDKVDERITKKQEALMATVQARAEAERAMQQRITAEEEGKKNVAVARYKALEEKERAVVNAEQAKAVAELGAQQRFSVAEFDTKAAGEYKKATILRAEADSESARKKFVADGALEKRLNNQLEINKVWAQAMAESSQPLVPSVMMGTNGNGHPNAAMDFMQIMATHAAKDLASTSRVSAK